MSRNKYPEQTVNKILDVSLKLFQEKGYEKTTIADIVNRLGMSKGAIYHHFKSKEDIIHAISEQCYHHETMVDDVVNDTSMNAIKKLQTLLYTQMSNEDKIAVDRLVSIDLAKNPKIFVANMEHSLNDNAVIIKKILDQGIKEGSIENQDTEAASQVIILLLNFWIYSPLTAMSTEYIIRKIKYFRFMTDSIGIPIITDDLENLAIKYFQYLSNNR